MPQDDERKVTGSMSVLVLVELSAKPGQLDDLTARLELALHDTRAFDGCEGATLHVNQDEPDRVLLVERWAGRGHHEQYSAWRQTDAGDSGIGDMLSGPPARRYFDDAPNR